MNHFLLFTVSILFLPFLQNNIHAFHTRKPIITPFRIEDAQPVHLFSRNSAQYVGVLNEKRCKNKHISKTRLASILLIPPEDDPKRKKKIDILSQPNPFSEFQPRQDPNNPLYTVFWKKCRECTELLAEMEARGLRVIFIDGQAIFDIIWDEPIVYKNEEILVGWFNIYEEILGNQGNAQAPTTSPPFQ